MKKNLSVFLVFLNIFLSKSLTSSATTNEKDVDKNAATIVSEVEKSDAEKIEEQKEAKGEKTKVEEKKKETISLEISSETIEKIKKMLSSETSEKCTKTRLAIETIFSVLLGVGILCSVKNQCFGTAEPIMTENTQEKGWFRSAFDLTKNAFFKISDKVLNGLPFYLLFKYV